jgi:4-amino-4-deoxy-L-arabinose transferase-like glycosyltransferase
MADFFRTRAGHYVLLTALAGVLFFWNLGSVSLWDVDEGRNATCTWEMYERGDWIVPTYNGELRSAKPALQYWLQMLAYQLCGVNEWGARLPSALAALASLFIAYEFGRRMFSKSTGLMAGIVLATTPMIIGSAHFANPDALLNLFTALTLFAFWRILERPTAWGYVFLGAATGFAVLAKGPIGIALPGLIGLLFLIWEWRLGHILDRRLGLAILSFITVTAPWYVLVTVATHGRFITEFLGLHNFGRFSATMEGHRGSMFYYVFVVFGGMMPWTIFVFGTIWATFWSCFRAPGQRWHARWQAVADSSGRGGAVAYRFLCVWFLAYFLFFSVSATKLPNYVLPLVVPASLLTARFLDRWRRGSIELPTWFWPIAAVGFASVGIVLGAGCVLMSGVGEWSVLRGRYFPVLASFAWLGLIPVVASVAIGWLARGGRRSATLVVFALASVAFYAPLVAFVGIVCNDYKAPEPLVRETPMHRRDIDLRVGVYDMEHLCSLNFYVKRDVRILRQDTELAEFLRLPLPAYVIINELDLERFRKAYPELGHEVGRHFDLYRHRDLVVLANGND